MRLTTALLPALLAPSALAAPYFPSFTSDIATQAFDSAQNWIHHAVQGATKHWAAHEATIGVDNLITGNVRMNDIDCMHSFP
jgi:hypothetical protein